MTVKLQDALGPRGDPSSLTDSVRPPHLGLGAAPSEPPGMSPAPPSGPQREDPALLTTRQGPCACRRLEAAHV